MVRPRSNLLRTRILKPMVDHQLELSVQQPVPRPKRWEAVKAKRPVLPEEAIGHTEKSKFLPSDVWIELNACFSHDWWLKNKQLLHP